MSLLVKITLIIALTLSIIIPFGVFLIGEKSRGRYKAALFSNVFLFFSIFLVAGIMMLTSSPVHAAETASKVSTNSVGMGYIAAALVTGMSCIGGGIAVANAASSALGAISENENILGKSLIFVGLAEGVCLYGLIISFMILGKL